MRTLFDSWGSATTGAAAPRPRLTTKSAATATTRRPVRLPRAPHKSVQVGAVGTVPRCRTVHQAYENAAAAAASASAALCSYVPLRRARVPQASLACGPLHPACIPGASPQEFHAAARSSRLLPRAALTLPRDANPLVISPTSALLAQWNFFVRCISLYLFFEVSENRMLQPYTLSPRPAPHTCTSRGVPNT